MLRKPILGFLIALSAIFGTSLSWAQPHVELQAEPKTEPQYKQPAAPPPLAPVTHHPPPPGLSPRPEYFFDWGRGNDGTGYCFEFDSAGYVMNQGRPVPENRCEAIVPTHFEWGQATNGFGYCFQFTPSHLVLWQGRPVNNQQCEYTQPSFYSWGRANNGGVYCFQFSPTGLVLNDGQAVPPQFCH